MRLAASSSRRLRLVLAAGAVLAGTATLVLLAGPVSTHYHLWRARAALARRDADAALQHLSAAGPAGERHAERHFLRARAHRRLGDSASAVQSLHDAKSLGYPPEALKREFILTRAQTGMIKETAPQLPDLLMNPGDDGREICECFVNGYLKNYQYDQAMKLLEAWMGDFPDDPLPHIVRGRIYQRWDQSPVAERQFRLALADAPDSVEARLGLAVSLAAQHRHEEAEREFSEVLKSRPHDTACRLAWAQCLLMTGRVDDAADVFTDVVQEDPRNCSALVGMGRVCLSRRRSAEAVRWLETAREIHPRQLDCRYSLAQALRAAGRHEEARQHEEYFAAASPALAEASRLAEELIRNPGSAEKRYGIGTTLLKYGSAEEGVNWLLTALELDPDHGPTHRALFDYFTEQGDSARADRHRRFLAQQPSTVASSPQEFGSEPCLDLPHAESR